MSSLKINLIVVAACFWSIAVVSCTNDEPAVDDTNRTSRQVGYYSSWPPPYQPYPAPGRSQDNGLPFWSQYYSASPVYDNSLPDAGPTEFAYNDFAHMRVKSDVFAPAANDALMQRQRPLPRVQWVSSDGSPCKPSLFKPFLSWLGLSPPATTTTTTTTTASPSTVSTTTCAPATTCPAGPLTADYLACTEITKADETGIYGLVGTGNDALRATSNAATGIVKGHPAGKNCLFVVVVSAPFNQIKVTCANRAGGEVASKNSLTLFGGQTSKSTNCQAPNTGCVVGANAGLLSADTYTTAKSPTASVLFSFGNTNFDAGNFCNWKMTA